MKRLVGLLALVALAAACSSSSSPAGPKQTVAPSPTSTVPAALREYAATFDSFALQVDRTKTELSRCVSPTAVCRTEAAASRKLVVGLLSELDNADSAREATSGPDGFPPGISPIVVKSEIAGRAVKRDAGAVSTHSSESALSQLAKQMRRLAKEVDAWEPGGLAAKALAAAGVSASPAPQAS